MALLGGAVGLAARFLVGVTLAGLTFGVVNHGGPFVRGGYAAGCSRSEPSVPT